MSDNREKFWGNRARRDAAEQAAADAAAKAKDMFSLLKNRPLEATKKCAYGEHMIPEQASVCPVCQRRQPGA